MTTTNARNVPPLPRQHGHAVNAEPLAALSTLTYRSRAVTPLSELELYRLLRSAQARNHSEGITGLLVYDHGCFLQTLEGPKDNLARVWASIRRDARHTAIEVLCDHATAGRFFPSWDLKLHKPAAPVRSQHDPAPARFELAPELIDELQQRPDAAPALLTTLALVPVTPPPVLPGADPLHRLLREIVGSVVIPRLDALHAQTQRALPAAHPRVAELVRLLIATDPRGAAALVGSAMARAGSFGGLCASLFEPVARGLGNLWQTDDCSEFDVTLGLCRLQSAIRQFSRSAARPGVHGQPAVLVVPQPGELHLLGAALDAELLWRGGWDMHTEFPASDDALDALLAGTWFDVLDLSLSAAFRREHWLPRLGETIAHARSASCNPALVVVVGGRVFGEQGDSGASLGADASCASAAQVEAAILGALHRGR